MQTFLTIIGFVACSAALTFAIIKSIEAVFFLQEFHEKVTKALARIEETLRNQKP